MSDQNRTGGAGPDVCPQCGTRNTPGARFCASCGTQLPEKPQEQQPASDKTWVVQPAPQQQFPQPPYQQPQQAPYQQPYQQGGFQQPPGPPAYTPAAPVRTKPWIIIGAGAVVLLLLAVVLLSLGGGQTIVGTWEETGGTSELGGSRLRFGEDNVLYVDGQRLADYEIVDSDSIQLNAEGEIIEMQYQLAGDRLTLTVEGDTLRLRRVSE